MQLRTLHTRSLQSGWTQFGNIPLIRLGFFKSYYKLLKSALIGLITTMLGAAVAVEKAGLSLQLANHPLRGQLRGHIR